jgi:hypothetical protein
MKESKSINSVKIGINNLLRAAGTSETQRDALEATLVQLALWEKCRENHKRRHMLQAEEQWSVFLGSYLSHIGSRGRLPWSYSNVEDVQKHLGRLVREL